jgi:hypothetical protein
MTTNKKIIATMTIQEFTKLLKNLPKEYEWVEFKKNNSNPQEIGEYLSALGNNGADKILCHGYVIIEGFCIYKQLIISSIFMSCLCHYQHYYIDY